MNKEEARQYILDRTKDYFPLDKSGKGYICPICGSGGGKNGTGITTKDGIHFTCWAGCFTNSDIFDIVGLEYELSNYNDQLEKLAEIFCLTTDKYHKETDLSKYQRQDKNKQMSIEETEIDYTDFFLEANKSLENTSYHRGISLETLNRFQVGYVENWKHPKSSNTITSPRLIIPTSKNSYLARDTRNNLTEKEQGFSKMRVGKTNMFNIQALNETKKPIFVVEGELDALSIIDVGGNAIGLGSTVNVETLLTVLKKQKPAQPLILAMDNDEAGIKASKKLVEGLERIKIPFYERNITQPYKDANEALNADKNTFRTVIGDIEKQILDEQEAHLDRESVAYFLPEFIKNIEQNKKDTFLSTGFANLDKILDGGLYTGLYILGAISSLGKTTFCLQIADQVAKQNHNVLIFSLEMPRTDLIAKSISRLTIMKSLSKNSNTDLAKSTRNILAGNYTVEEKKLMYEVMEDYQEYGKNIYIIEGIGNLGIEAIRERVDEHKRIKGKSPMVLIDYLQMIAPYDARATDKQNIDKAVLELKRLSRDYDIPVVVISSFNRENYNHPVNLTSFKESGAIEYSSDVLIGLQYEGMDYEEGETDGSARKERLRNLTEEVTQQGNDAKAQKIQLKVLKNRHGRKGSINLGFYPMFNYFTESKDVVEQDDDWNEVKRPPSLR